MNPTASQMSAAILMSAAVAEAIRELDSIPSGQLYAQLVEKMDFQTYTYIINSLKKAKLVEEKNHLLTWVGPFKNQKS
jgi:hypothetical protein